MPKMIIIGIVFSAVVSSCNDESGKQNNNCDNVNFSELGQPASVDMLLKLSDTFVAASFNGVDETDLTSEATKCTFPARIANLQNKRNEIFAVSELDGAMDKVISLEDPCGERTVEEYVCDIQESDAGVKIDGGCELREIDVSRCKLPRWHYLIPKDGGEYGIFLASDPLQLDKPRLLAMILELSGDVLDMSVLEGGEKIALSDLEELLRRNSNPEVPKFWW